MAPETLTGACVIAALQLLSPGMHDVAVLDCELHRLSILSKADAAEWDDLATACISPDTLTSTAMCPRLPLMQMGGTPVFSLYNPEAAVAFFDEQTTKTVDHCSTWYFGEEQNPEACSCNDLVALKTLGSHRRKQVLLAHAARTEAAAHVRARRTLAVRVLQQALTLRCADAAIDCDAVRTMYATDKAAEAAHPVASANPEYITPTTLP
jgi:hypothetical protein